MSVLLNSIKDNLSGRIVSLCEMTEIIDGKGIFSHIVASPFSSSPFYAVMFTYVMEVVNKLPLLSDRDQ